MKCFIFCMLLWSLICFSALALAEEPILVIDPHGHSSQINDILFTPDGETLISVSEDKTIRLWDVKTGDLKQTLRHQIGEGRDGVILSGALSPDGKILAVGGISSHQGDKGTPVYLFDLESGEVTRVLTGHPHTIDALEFSQDGKWLASGSGPEIRIWETSTMETTPVLILENPSIVFDLTFSPDAENLLSGHEDGRLRLWELPKNLGEGSASRAQTLTKPKKVIKKHPIGISCLDYSPDGTFFISGDHYGNTFLWDSKKGKVKKKFTPMDTVGALAFSPDSKKVVLGGGKDASAQAVVYTIPKGKKITTFTEHASPVESVAFSNNVTAIAFYGNDLIATAGGNDYDIYIWDVNTQTIKTHIAGQGKRVEAVAFGENLQVAFGNTSGGFVPSYGLHAEGPLERVFDFAEMILNQKLPPETEFTRTQKEYQGKKLKYTRGKWFELDVTKGGTIKNSPPEGFVRSYTFTPNGDVVVGSSHKLALYRTDGEIIHEFVGHTGEIWDVSISLDGRILASASDDQTIRLWNLNTGEGLATLFVARDREWVCWTPTGYYAASAGGEKYIGWQLNQGMDKAAKYYPVSAFRKRFHHPELVKRTIAFGNFEQALAEINIEKATVTEVLPPKVQWISPEAATLETTQPSIQIRAEIQSDSALTAIKVLVNGRTQAKERGLAMAGQERALDSIIDQEIALTPGKNEFAIFAANENAGTTSDTRIVLYNAEESKPDLYMVSVGISQYQRSDLQLNYADDDAKAISQVFRSQQGILYNKVIIKELYDQDASKAQIIEALEWLQQQATQKDVAVIFIAAHGTNEQGEYYLLPADSNIDDIERTFISWKVFSESLGDLPARVVLFLDTCHSGQLGQDLAVLGKQVDNTEAIRKLSSIEYGVVILAASTGREFSLEHPQWGHGAFTKALIEAMEQGQADYSADGIILLRELDLYVAERVDALTNGEQHPTTQKPSTISRFPVVQVK